MNLTLAQRQALQVLENSSDFSEWVDGLLEGKRLILSESEQEELERVRHNWPLFLRAIDKMYFQMETHLEILSRNLQLSSDELSSRNRNLSQLNQTLSALINSLNQGFLLFDKNGICGPIYSKVCEDFLEVKPQGLPIAQVLKVPESETKRFQMWIGQLFREVIEFSELVPLGPKSFPHSKERFIELDYKPMRNTKGQIEQIVLIATDTTLERQAQNQFRHMKSSVERINAILDDAGAFTLKVDAFEQMGKSILEANAQTSSEDVLRILHTAKSLAGSLSFPLAQEKIHELETGLAKADRHAWPAMIAAHADLFVTTLGQCREDLAKYGLRKASHKPTLASFFAQENSHLQSLAKAEGKKLHPLKTVGDDEEIPAAWGSFINSLEHVFSNMVVHGIEVPEQRARLGKDPAGLIEITIGKNATDLSLHIKDDGAGLDEARLLSKMRQSGKVDAAAVLSPEQIWDTIFLDGVSTKDSVDTRSGRGVGMSSVKAELQKLGGTYELSSKPGLGFGILFKLPVLIRSDRR